MTVTAQQDLPSTNTANTDQPATNAPSERRMLSKAQVAARMGCSERSLERLVKQGRFPAPKRFGRAVVWFGAAVEHVLVLAEQEQLQWQPAAVPTLGVSGSMAVQDEPPVPSLVPAAHELEPVIPDTARKPRKSAGSAKRRELTGASAADLRALGQVFQLPTV